jgi:hypothetical protein
LGSLTELFPHSIACLNLSCETIGITLIGYIITAEGGMTTKLVKGPGIVGYKWTDLLYISKAF